MRNRFAGFAGVALLCLSILCTSPAHAEYVGNYAVGTDNICKIFNTYQPSTGASFGMTAEEVDVYKDDGTTQDNDSGLTIDDDFDALTGAHQVCVDTSSDGTFYSAGSTFTVVISAGAVDGVSVVGTEVMTFTLEKTSVAHVSANAITATAVAADAIGASEIATDAIGAAELAANSITSSEVADDSIDAGAIAADAIGASELAANSITASEVADDAIDAGAVAANTLTTAEIATGAISADEVADDAIDAGAIAANAIAEDAFATTAGSFDHFGIVDQGTAQSATSTTLVLRSAAAFADDELNGNEILITGGSAGVGQTRLITDYTSADDTATVATWTTTPSGTITYQVRSDTATGGSVSIGVGGIAANSFAAGAIDASAIAANAIGASEIADNAIDAGAIATGAIGEAEFATTAGTFFPLGIIDQGTAQGATGTELQLRSAAAFANDEIIGATILITGGSTGVGQSRTITDYVSSTDTATVDAWTTTPTGTITYEIFGTAPGGAGSSLTQADIRTAVGLASANLDTQLSAIDDFIDTEVAAILDDTGTSGVQLPAGEITSATFGAGAIDASAIATDAIGAAEIAANALTTAEIATGAISADEVADNAIDAGAIADASIDAATFAASAIDATAIAANAIGASELAADAITASELATDSISSDELAATATAEIVAAEFTAQRILSGTCDSGSTTTCVDDALTQAAESQLDDRLICFDDSWCALITGFTAGTDTVTTTKTAPSTRASKAYTIFPATLQ